MTLNETRDSVSYSTALQATADLSLRMEACMFILQGIVNRMARFITSHVLLWRTSNNSLRFNSSRFMINSAIHAHPPPASTRFQLVLTQRLHRAQLLFPPLHSLQRLREHRRPYGRPDHSPPELLQKSMAPLANRLLRFV